MDDLLKAEDFVNTKHYKTLALDTEFDSKLELVTEIVNFTPPALRSSYRCTVNDVVYTTRSLEDAVSAYNNAIRHA